MELYIDNKSLDLDAGTEIAISLSVADVTDPQKGRTGYTRTVRVPSTPRNDAIFGFAAEVHAADGFNRAPHTGRIEHEGVVMMEGPLYLGSSERGNFYEVHLIGASKEWVSKASARSLGSLEIEWSGRLSAETISDSWTEDTPVRFLPVAREMSGRDYSSGGVIPTVKVLSSDDYHPFLHAATLLRAIFAESGYTVESDFADSEFFQSLYISGNYPTRDTSVVKADMDFMARRLAAGSAVANSQGRVYADPYQIAFTVGNIVDTASPEEACEAGVSYEDVFTRNGCFQMDDDRVAFIPASAVSVGFQFHLRYTTDYRMKSRTELAGFDTVYLGEQAARTFTLANPYPDRRSSFRSLRRYNLAIFEWTAGRQYQLRYTQKQASGADVTVSSEPMAARFSFVAVTEALSVSNPVLWWRTSPTASWQIYSGDWALYDGFVGETGTMDVELTVRTAPETVTPGRPKFFNDIYFGGADAGMRLTVSEKSWLKPVFYAQPTEGSHLNFADVCAHSSSQMDFIGALRHMFNLRFHTDNRSRVVRIEPADEFYSEDKIVDLSGLIDFGKPISVEELGGDLSRRMAWCYRSGDGAVARFDRTADGDFGYWSASVESFAATDQTSVWENPMFSPSLGTAGTHIGVPSALLIRVGDSSSDTPDRIENLNFIPKIVRWDGMKPLPEGEWWGWPLSGNSYPKIAFHAPESGYTLCFEDRDGCTGLHTLRDHDVRLWNHSRRVTLWLALDAVDISSLSFPTGHGVDFRSLVRLTIDGEPALYRLEEVCDYTPGAASVKCVLIKHIP